MTDDRSEREGSERPSFEGQHAFKGSTSMDPPTEPTDSSGDEDGEEGLSFEGQHAFKGNTSQEPRVDK